MKRMIAACAAALLYGLASQAWAQNNIRTDPAFLSMEDAVARALEAAPSIHASGEAVRATSGALRQARTRPNPEISLEAADVGGSGTFNGIERTELTFSVGQRIERGGKRGARIDLAGAECDMARLSASIARHDVIFTARQAYIDAMAASAAFKNAEIRAKVARELEEAINRRVQRARDSVAAQQSIAARALEAKADLDQARYALRTAKRRLSALWGETEDDFEIDRSLLFDVTLTDESAFQNRWDDILDLRLADATGDRASAALTLERAKAKQDPTVKLGVRRFQQSDDVAAIVSFSIPIALFDTNRGNIERAAAESRRREWIARDARMRIERKLTTNLGTLRAAYAEALDFRKNIIPRAQAALDETRAGYERGAFTYLEILEARRAHQEFQAREISALKRFHLSNAVLDRLTAEYEAPLSGEED